MGGERTLGNSSELSFIFVAGWREVNKLHLLELVLIVLPFRVIVQTVMKKVE
jgi:hypothetical protein